MKKFLLITFLVGLFFPLISFAGQYTGYSDSNRNGQFDEGEATTTVVYEGLVPCGKADYNELVESPEVTNPCQFCHFFVMFDGLIDFVATLVILVAILILVVGGALYIFSAGNPGMLARVKSLITSVVIGLAIIFGAWLIINTIFAFIGLSEFGLRLTGPGQWFTVNCPIKLP